MMGDFVNELVGAIGFYMGCPIRFSVSDGFCLCGQYIHAEDLYEEQQ